MKTHATQQQLYIVFWIIIAVLIGLIGWFTYLLIQPNVNDPTESTNTTTTNETSNTENVNAGKKKKNKNTNAANTNAATDDDGSSSTTTNTNNASDDEGLVEPEATDDATEADADAAASDVTDENEEATADNDETTDDTATTKVTLYFPKADSDCGEVYPVERDVEPTDDPYGQIILEAMHGPSDEETGYDNAVPSGLYLRQVEYTAAGAVITVSEAYDDLDSCAQQTVTAQLVETANAMFELAEGTTGEVVVGTVDSDDDSTDDNADSTDTDSEDIE
jgi:hypothetical protein